MLKIKEVREQRKLSQDEVVRRSGIPKRSYLNYESGQTDVPVSKLQNIAIALEVPLVELLDEPKSSIANEDQENYYRVKDLKMIHMDLKKDLKELSAGMTKNFEVLSDGVFENLKQGQKSLRGQEKILEFIDSLNADEMITATSRLSRFLQEQQK